MGEDELKTHTLLHVSSFLMCSFYNTVSLFVKNGFLLEHRLTCSDQRVAIMERACEDSIESAWSFIMGSLRVGHAVQYTIL